MPRFRDKPTPCFDCPANKTSWSYVPGTGPLTARIALIGQGPGEKEAYDGEPFVGPSGNRLNQQLHKAGLRRGEFYVDNIVRCWMPKVVNPPRGNRAPRAREVAYCMEHFLLPTLRDMPNLEGVVLLGKPAQRAFIKDPGDLVGSIKEIELAEAHTGTGTGTDDQGGGAAEPQ